MTLSWLTRQTSSIKLEMIKILVNIFKAATLVFHKPISFSYYLQDALTLQRVCLEKKVDLVDEKTNEVPDVKAIVQELMTSLFISVYNYQVFYIYRCGTRVFQHLCYF